MQPSIYQKRQKTRAWEGGSGGSQFGIPADRAIDRDRDRGTVAGTGTGLPMGDDSADEDDGILLHTDMAARAF